MKSRIFFLFLLVLTAHPAFSETMPWQIDPCTAFGPIQSKTTLADLIRVFGKDNVQDTQIEGPEGESYPGAIVFPNDPAKKATVIWKDAVKNAPSEVSVDGMKSVWKTAQGVTLGTPLSELEKLNKSAFTISGFGWDYGGRVLSWGNGALSSAFPKAFSIALSPDPAKPDQKISPAVSGDKPVSSANPALRIVSPIVTEMSCQFP